MRNFYIILLIMLVLIGTANAQKHFNNWYFGDSAGVTFNTKSGEPAALLNGVLKTTEGCSSISDSDGRLLFYTNGVTVWNRLHQIMKNGDSLYGHYSSSQSALIVPKPGTSCIYYIFTVGAGSYISDPIQKGLNYSVVDMSLENTLGAITQKNIPLLDTKSERLAATAHQNGKDIWIIANNSKNKNFVSYLLTSDSLNSNPILSPHIADINTSHIGMIKFSHDGKKLALTTSQGLSRCQLYDFDYLNGKISNEITFNVSKKVAYGLEFSKNGKFLYVTSENLSKKRELYQYDISTGNPATILSSEYKIFESDSIWFWGLQMGPNNKIYIAAYYRNLSVIHKPDEKGTACNFKLNDVDLGGRFSSIGLPSVVQHYIPEKRDCVYDIIDICSDETLYLMSIYYADAKYEWTGPNGYTSTIWNPVIKNSTPEMSGVYHYRIIFDDSEITGSVNVTVYSIPKILFADSSELFVIGKSYTLKAVENPFETKFTWYGIDSDENEVIITKSGTYKVIAENLNGCKDSATIFIKIYSAYCYGDDIILDSYHIEPEDSIYNTEYLWSGPNGFTSTVKNPVLENVNESNSGDYEVRIITKFGTGDFEGERDTIYTKVPVFVYGDLGLEISAGKIRICDSDSTDIFSIGTYSEYLWSTGETTESITVHDAGNYHLIVKNEFGCSDSAEIEISKFDANVTFDKEKLIFDELCLGDSKIDKLQLKVETNSDFVVNRIYTTSNNFSVTNSNSLLKSYQNGDTVELEIKFEPLDAGEFFDTLFVESEEPCIYRVALPIYGSSKALFRFALPEFMTEVGKKIEIPINSALICPNANKLSADYEIEISVDKAYFLPQSLQFGEIIKNEIVGNDRILKIQARAEFEKLSGDLKTINIIYGQTLIGRSESVPIVIEDVKFSNERYFPEYQNGSLLLEGCVNDLSGIQIFKPTTMKVAPNPADGDLKVTVGTQEEGSFSIVIYDFQGRVVAKSEFTRSNRIYEENDYTFNISGLGTGVYSVHLTAPWTLKREQLVIVK